MITGNIVKLRTVVPDDLEILLEWENRPELWPVSDRKEPVSRSEMQDFVHGHHDLLLERQLRMMVCTHSGHPVGTIDLFNFDLRERSASLGILIANSEDRRKGMALEAIKILKRHCFGPLKMRCLRASVQAHNDASKNLFEKAGFNMVSETGDIVHFELQAESA